MLIDRKLSNILSEFFLDISKASFIAMFITSPTTDYGDIYNTVIVLTRYIFGVILFMYLAWMFKEK
jgi:hypothetical protein